MTDIQGVDGGVVEPVEGLNGRVFVIVGATGGVGQVLTRILVRRGAKVIAAARDKDRLAGLRDRIALDEQGAELDYKQTDASSGSQMKALFDHVAAAHGRVDGAVNLAGSILIKPLQQTTDEDWDLQIGQNLTTAFNLVRASVSAVSRAPGNGSVVLVSSVAGGLGLIHHEAVAAAKGGVEGLALAAAASAAHRGVRVNVVAPGMTRTPMSAHWLRSESMEKASAAMHPMGRIGEPEDVAHAIAWLLSPESRFVTGQVIAVDGGFRSLRPRG